MKKSFTNSAQASSKENDLSTKVKIGRSDRLRLQYGRDISIFQILKKLHLIGEFIFLGLHKSKQLYKPATFIPNDTYLPTYLGITRYR